MARLAVAGAGFSGAVIAQELARDGHEVDVFDPRPHVAGNCHTERDAATGVLLHRYGPHIFHTDNERVWNYVRQFGEFMPFTNRVKAIVRGQVYSMPVNLHTMNQFFGRCFSPSEAQAFLATQTVHSDTPPRNFEEQALAWMGPALYEAFFCGYTQKQWGRPAAELPASVLKRLPLRFSYDDNYYTSRWQGIPRDGYTGIVERLLDRDGIRVFLGTPFTREMCGDYVRVFYSGPIDAWFGHDEGRLGYRTLDFAIERHDGDFQGNAVINYGDADVPWTRIAEHKHFAPWESHRRTVISRETSRDCQPGDTPYYPLRLATEKTLLAHYIRRARNEQRVSFVGRLGTYRYIDMHVTIAEALDWADRWRSDGLHELPALNVDPLA